MSFVTSTPSHTSIFSPSSPSHTHLFSFSHTPTLGFLFLFSHTHSPLLTHIPSSHTHPFTFSHTSLHFSPFLSHIASPSHTCPLLVSSPSHTHPLPPLLSHTHPSSISHTSPPSSPLGLGSPFGSGSDGECLEHTASLQPQANNTKKHLHLCYLYHLCQYNIFRYSQTYE